LRFHFTAVVTSSVEGVAKPDPRLFEIALARCGAAPVEAISVGDDIERDVAAAAKIGIHGILLDRFDDHPDFTPRVESLGRLVELLPARVTPRP
jgi:putative hydrolase of the HAD superfamily